MSAEVAANATPQRGHPGIAGKSHALCRRTTKYCPLKSPTAISAK